MTERRAYLVGSVRDLRPPAVSRLPPHELDIAPLLAEANRQLHEEADYVREQAMLDRYRLDC